jgi:uncharacterized membrane protein YfcA
VPELLLVLAAGLAAGALNAAGGGGTFVALPALVAVGLSPVVANASTTVALLPGALASAWTYRREIAPVGTTPTRSLTAVSMLGGGLGAGLLLVLPSSSFDAAVPWLLAFATVVLAFGRQLSRLLGGSLTMGTRPVLAGQLVLAIYGGYFGGAVGILMLALWSVGLGMDAATGNPMRVAQLGAVYGVASVVFLLAGDVVVDPGPLVVMLVGGIAGGLLGAQVVRRLPARVLRAVVLTTAVTMTILYFVREFR